jgi:hypothetical protein
VLARTGRPHHVYLLRAGIAAIELVHDLALLPVRPRPSPSPPRRRERSRNPARLL